MIESVIKAEIMLVFFIVIISDDSGPAHSPPDV